MDDKMRARVWAEWIEVFPDDADLDDRGQDAMLGTLMAQVMAARIAVRDMADAILCALHIVRPSRPHAHEIEDEG